MKNCGCDKCMKMKRKQLAIGKKKKKKMGY
jgi:hypothetical protein